MKTARNILLLLVIITVLVAMIAYVPGFRHIGSISKSFIPMAPSTASAFILFVLLIFLQNSRYSENKVFSIIYLVVIIIVTLFCFLEIPGHYTGLDLNFEGSIVPDLGRLGSVPIARMSPSTGLFFTLLGLTLLIISIRQNNKNNTIGGVIIVVVFFGCLTFLLAYMHQNPLFYNSSTIPMALTTAFAFVFLSAALTFNLGKNSFPLVYFSGKSTKSRLIRAFLPIFFIAILYTGSINDFSSRWFGINQSIIVSCAIVIGILILFVIISKVSKIIGRSIDYYQAELIKKEKEAADLAKFPSENSSPVLRIEENGIILYANAAAQKLLSEDINKETNVLNRWKNNIKDSFKTQKDIYIPQSKEKDKYYSWKLVPVENTTYLNIYGMDITKLKKMERKLSQSMKMEVVGQLAGGVAHDFNNILTVITGYNCLLETAIKRYSSDNSEVLEYLEEIKKATTKASALTKQLLFYGRKNLSRITSVDINSCIQELSSILHRTIPENIKLNIKLVTEINNVMADKSQIDQIIMNLVINSKDSMPDGGIITVESSTVSTIEAEQTTKNTIAPGPYTVLSVSDTGKGIEKRLQDKIFEPFFTTKELGVGSGLGLSTIYEIVKNYKGHINLYSELNIGTTFKIYLPAQTSDVTYDIIEERKITPITMKKTVILIVEDNKGILNLTSTIFNNSGFVVISAHNGEQAIAIIKETKCKIDVLLTDVIMTGMNGKELAIAMKGKFPQLKVLFMSGYTANVIAHHGVLDSNVNFIEKPYTAEQILKAVNDIL